MSTPSQGLLHQLLSPKYIFVVSRVHDGYILGKCSTSSPPPLAGKSSPPVISPSQALARWGSRSHTVAAPLTIWPLFLKGAEAPGPVHLLTGHLAQGNSPRLIDEATNLEEVTNPN